MDVALVGCSRWPEGHDDDAGVVEALAAVGFEASWAVWDDGAVDWSAFDIAVLRETWDYPGAVGRFLRWIDDVDAATTLLNPAPIVRWNHHKRYLLDLAEAGVPVVPTVLLRAGDRDAARPWADAVVKPVVGVGGDGLERVGPDEPVPAGDGERLLQPYLASLETAGETSVILLDGVVSHVVRKVPAAGEYRAHEHRGAAYRRVDARPEQAAVAHAAWQAVVGYTGYEPMYARADLVEGPDGEVLLGELELIEPSLYLHHVPEATATLAEAILAATRRRRRP